MADCLILGPTPVVGVFVTPDGKRCSPPSHWAHVPPGDAMLTRRVKAAGPSWAVVEKKGRKTFSKGLWADAATIERIRAEVERERSTEGYAKKRVADVARRERAESDYVVTFESEVMTFLAFSSEWAPLGRAVAKAVAAHATPVGSGTVARTKRIPVAERAEAAVIAWMRHQTTAYDQLHIPRVAGKRREVRRELARISRGVLARHQTNVPHGIDGCPLCKAVVDAKRAESR